MPAPDWTLTLQALYTAPLLTPKAMPRSDNRRADAVCQVRLQMGGIVSEIEYQIVVAAHLLWWGKRNSEAYWLPAGLILSAEAALCGS